MIHTHTSVWTLVENVTGQQDLCLKSFTSWILTGPSSNMLLNKLSKLEKWHRIVGGHQSHTGLTAKLPGIVRRTGVYFGRCTHTPRYTQRLRYRLTHTHTHTHTHTKTHTSTHLPTHKKSCILYTNLIDVKVDCCVCHADFSYSPESSSVLLHQWHD